MTVQEIIDLAYGEYGNKYQVSPEQILSFLNLIQEMAFNKDINQFLVWDIPIIIIDGQLSYNYPEPSDLDNIPAVRKLLGVTDVPEKAILNDIYGYSNLRSGSDYGFEGLENGRRNGIYVSGRIDNIRRIFTFANTPSTKLGQYRWIYYLKPKKIRNATDDDRLIIPETWHYQVAYNGVVAMMDSATYGGKTYEERLRPILEPFWSELTSSETGLNGLFTEAT